MNRTSWTVYFVFKDGDKNDKNEYKTFYTKREAKKAVAALEQDIDDNVEAWYENNKEL